MPVKVTGKRKITMKKLHLDINANETQEKLSDRATSETNKLTEAGTAVICVQTLPDYAEIQYFD